MHKKEKIVDNINLWLWLESKNLNKKTKYILYEEFGSIENIYEAKREDYENCNVSMSSKYIDELCDKNIDIEQTLNNINKFNVKVVAIDQIEYPNMLKNIEYPPVVLYCRGNFVNLNEKVCVSVVGSRKMSVYGKNVAYSISKQLSQRGIVVVSGMAYGIDTMAHIGALDGEGITVAVLGCGVDIAYPKTNRVLMERILKTGMVISELPVGFAPMAYNFPERNKIVAALSVGTLVVEADIKSGSLITANLAKEYNRDIYAIPGNIDSPFAKGTNFLIQNGAGLVTSSDDIIKNYPEYNNLLSVKKQTTINNEEKGSPIEKKIMNCLKSEPVSIDFICEKSGIDIATLNANLLIMEIKGKIAKHPGNRYSINEGRI